jgi:SRSO17 transposase
MTPQRVRAAAGQFEGFHKRFLWHFGRREARDHSRVYLRGLLLHDERKTCESMALRFALARDGSRPGRREVQALQHFLTHSPWDHHAVQREIQDNFVEEFAAGASPVGMVGVIDESGDEKSGTHSCGAATQWFGRIGKTEVCQVGVFLIGVASQASVLLDHQLFLPEAWAKDQKRRKKTGVPKAIKFRSKPKIAAELVERTMAGPVRFDWITADSLYGKNGHFLDELERLGQRYVVETACDVTFWMLDPATQIPAYCGQGAHPVRATRDSVRRADAMAAELPAAAWQPIKLREGAKGPLVAEFARMRVWAVRHAKPHRPVWLVFRRELGSREVKYYVSNADEPVSLETLALVIATRWRVEEFFEDAKAYLGLADYETRGWTSWHHHMTLVALAHLYVMLVRKDLRGDVPELSFDRAYHLVCDGMSRPRLSPEESLRLTEYYLNYNHLAHESHRKSWLKRHKRLATQLRL